MGDVGNFINNSYNFLLDFIYSFIVMFQYRYTVVCMVKLVNSIRFNVHFVEEI